MLFWLARIHYPIVLLAKHSQKRKEIHLLLPQCDIARLLDLDLSPAYEVRDAACTAELFSHHGLLSYIDTLCLSLAGQYAIILIFLLLLVTHNFRLLFLIIYNFQ